MNFKLKKNFQQNVTGKAVEDYALEASRHRLIVILIFVCFAFLTLIFRLFDISLSSTEDVRSIAHKSTNTDFFLQRANITDRNGVLLATNLTTASLYANPQKIINPQEVSQKLCKVFTNVNCKELTGKLKSGKTFTWVKRHLTPREQQLVHDMGLPGLYFSREEKRVYPQGNLMSHALGFVDVDGNGLAGIEKYYNDSLVENNNKPLKLSLDSRIQQVLKEEIANQISLHGAIGGSGIIMDTDTGEVLALVSLPDFDPHHVSNATDRQRFNQITLGVYEMGSTFKALTLAMGLDGRHVGVNDAFNVNEPIKVGRFRIHDYKGKGGVLSVPEILMYSSNIGTAQIAMKVGAKAQRDYLKEFGLLETPSIELPEKAHPLYPPAKLWGHASLITISYGHGMAVTPLHVAQVYSSIINGGILRSPTLVKVENSEDLQSKEVISQKTSDIMRKLLRLVVTHGSGKRADAVGYLVAGKTGTAEKISGKRYNKHANIASFIGGFPINAPKYTILVLIDEAMPNKINGGVTMGGTIAAPVVGQVVARIAPLLGIEPVNDRDPEIKASLAVDFTPRRGPLN